MHYAGRFECHRECLCWCLPSHCHWIVSKYLINIIHHKSKPFWLTTKEYWSSSVFFFFVSYRKKWKLIKWIGYKSYKKYAAMRQCLYKETKALYNLSATLLHDSHIFYHHLQRFHRLIISKNEKNWQWNQNLHVKFQLLQSNPLSWIFHEYMHLSRNLTAMCFKTSWLKILNKQTLNCTDITTDTQWICDLWNICM